MSNRSFAISAILLAAFLAAAFWAGTHWAGLDPEKSVAIWDLVIKGVVGTLTLIGALIAVFRYLDDRSKAIEVAGMEARKPFLERRQAIYIDLVETTAAISTIQNYDDPVSVAAERKFWTIFWGTLPLVTDEPVSRLADGFSELLADHSMDWVRLRNASMNIARACRASMGFDPPLPPPSAVTQWQSARPRR